MKTSKMLMVAFSALIIASCSNDNDLIGQQTDNPNEDAQDVYASFSISIPHGSKTRGASVTDTGITTENLVNSLYIFIYDAESPHAPTVAKFTVADGTLKQETLGSSKWITSQPVSTKKADKYIFAGVNLNSDIVSYITSNGFGAFSYKEFAQDITKLADQTNGFVMFNDVYPNLTPSANLYDKKADAESNHISISVNRVTAKAAVFKSPTFVVNGGGTMTDLKFGWRNLNKKFYFMQDERDALIKDYNWDSYAVQDFNRGSDAINVYASTDIPTSFSYTTENAFQYIPDVSNINGTTFISISGVFTPTNIISAQKSSPATAADFETIANSNPAGTTFYVVRTTDGIANYFIDASAAEKFAELCAANTPGMPSFHGTYNLSENTFSNGLCYYHIFVNSDAVSPQAPYNVYRNQYFKININSIQAPGNPSDNFDNGKPIQSNSWIGVDIEITPWEVIEEDHDL
ncbi:Mfa1 family fimbria major subunit [Phocaeicola sp.]